MSSHVVIELAEIGRGYHFITSVSISPGKFCECERCEAAAEIGHLVVERRHRGCGSVCVGKYESVCNISRRL